MKQRITVDQLNELTDEQKECLREWWNPVEGDHFVRGDSKYFIGQTYLGITYLLPEHFPEPSAFPLLSIGQMIELLSVHYGSRSLSVLDAMGISIVHSTPNEICDVLWEAVKAVI